MQIANNLSRQSLLLSLLFSAATSWTMEDSKSFTGSVNFSQDEINYHLKNINTLVSESTSCAQKAYSDHLSFFAKWGISAFYGDNSKFSRMGMKGQIQYLDSLGVPANVLEQLRPTSCIGLAYMCLKASFEQTGQKDVWKRIFDFTQKNGGDGLALQLALQKLGWKIFYWNPDPNRNITWDDQETAADPKNDSRFWGYHAYRYQTVNGKEHRYLYNPVDDYKTLIGFDRSVPKLLSNTPFYLGVVHGGYHVFLGAKDRVIEGHSTRDITSKYMIEDNQFDPLNPLSAGPTGNYRTGLMAIPPAQIAP